MVKVKDIGKILKAAREKQLVMYQGKSVAIRLSEFSAETLQDRRKWRDIFKV